jgi:hypothetical protein
VRISVELFGQLLPGAPRRHTLDLPRGARVRTAAERLGMRPEAIGLVTINGLQSGLDDPLPDGCRLCFFPHLSGG